MCGCSSCTNWHGWQHSINDSTSVVIDVLQIFERNLSFVRTTPWRPSWAYVKTVFCKGLGMTFFFMMQGNVVVHRETLFWSIETSITTMKWKRILDRKCDNSASLVIWFCICWRVRSTGTAWKVSGFGGFLVCIWTEYGDLLFKIPKRYKGLIQIP